MRLHIIENIPLASIPGIRSRIDDSIAPPSKKEGQTTYQKTLEQSCDGRRQRVTRLNFEGIKRPAYLVRGLHRNV